MPHNTLIIHTDGGARGNPGPAAIGVVIDNKHYHEYIGTTTNNVAEYKAVIFALIQALKTLGPKKAKQSNLEMYTDSELIAKQLLKLYKVKQPHLKPLWQKATNMQKHFASVRFVIIPRKENKEADALVNEALDKNT